MQYHSSVLLNTTKPSTRLLTWISILRKSSPYTLRASLEGCPCRLLNGYRYSVALSLHRLHYHHYYQQLQRTRKRRRKVRARYNRQRTRHLWVPFEVPSRVVWTRSSPSHSRMMMQRPSDQQGARKNLHRKVSRLNQHLC